MWCALHGIPTIALGTLAANPFPDADREFFEGVSALASRALGCPLEVVTPFAGRKKSEVLDIGRDLALNLTFSCIAPLCRAPLWMLQQVRRTAPCLQRTGHCRYHCLRNTVTGRHRRFIAPVSFGLGDLVVSLPVVQAAVRSDRRSGGETWLVTRSQSQVDLAERISGLAGTVAEGDGAINPETYIDLRDHPLQRDHWWGTPAFAAAYGPLTINQIIARIGADFGLVGDFTEPRPLEARGRPDAEGLVVLVADTDGAAKRWAPDRWVGLATVLGQQGLDIAVVTRG